MTEESKAIWVSIIQEDLKHRKEYGFSCFGEEENKDDRQRNNVAPLFT